jgi:hypothetical protein
MPLVIPGLATITHGTNGYDAQTVPDPTDVAALQGVGTGTGVVTGCALTAQSSPNMTGQLTAGWVMVNGLFYQVSAVNPVTFASADSTDRKDIVVYTVGTGVVVVKGTDCGTAGWTRALTGTALPPEKPGLPANTALLWESTINSSTTSVTSINLVDKRAPIAATPGTLLARAANAPSTATIYTLITIATGLTALDTTNLVCTFPGPPSGAVLVKLTGFCHPTAATVASKVIFGVVSSTGSPGTMVGTAALAYSSPTATIADNNAMATTVHLITGLTAGTSYTWYFAGAFATAAGSVIAQGGSTNTTTPTGAPAVMEVWAA